MPSKVFSPIPFTESNKLSSASSKSDTNLIPALSRLLDTVELIMQFEEEFDIEISDEQAENISTVQSAIDYINNSSD